MKRFGLVLFFVLFFPVFCLSGQSDSVIKANEFAKAGKLNDAIQLLEQGIQKNVLDIDAHWMLGELYLKKNYYISAAKRFNRAVQIKPSLIREVGGLYKRAGQSELATGNIEQAISLFTNAVDFDTRLRKAIGHECYIIGKKYLSPGQSKVADKLFSFAISSDPSLSAEIQKTQLSYGNFMLEVANSKPKPERRKYVNEAEKYLSQGKIDEISPPSPWQTIYKKTFVGVGDTGGDDPEYKDGGLFTAKTGKDIWIGDRYTVVDANFELWIDGKWETFARGQWIIVKDVEAGLDLTFRNSKGQKFTVVVQRYID